MRHNFRTIAMTGIVLSIASILTACGPIGGASIVGLSSTNNIPGSVGIQETADAPADSPEGAVAGLSPMDPSNSERQAQNAKDGNGIENAEPFRGLFYARSSADEDDSTDAEASDYSETLMSYEEALQTSKTALDAAQDVFDTTSTSLSDAESALRLAETTFRAAEMNGDSDALDTAWTNVSNALSAWSQANDNYEQRLQEHEDAENSWEKRSIWLEQYKNDYEALSSQFAVKEGIAGCKTVSCSADNFLDDERFTVFQPHVLELVGAHHAYAKGLTGDGVRIAIEDDIVNYTLPEFAGRISFDGTKLTYPIRDGDDFFSDSKTCERASTANREVLGCKLITFTSDYDELEILSARWVVANYGWPEEGERWFLRNDHYGESSWWKWSEIPHATNDDDHGTAVASVAAGRDFGLAPGATIIPVARNFDPEGQQEETEVSQSLLRLIALLPDSERAEIDIAIAGEIEKDYTKYDVINRSFGIGVFDPASISAVLNDETQWWGEGLRTILPQTWRAFMQTGTHPDDRTVVVYAAGNETEEYGGLGADIPYYEPHVRSHQLSVMAVDHDGSHAAYTNFCGPLPSDWDSDRWGRHYCLAAPGTVNAAGSAGEGYIFHEIDGTSFAAPVVSGSIALLMEHFRGQLGNTAIVKRVVDTANNDGRYAQLEIYGAGLLDLGAALQPVGSTTTGTSSIMAGTTRTTVRVPSALGALGQRFAAHGVEVASLDSMGAPFWSSPQRYVFSIDRQGSMIPAFSQPVEEEIERLQLGFLPGTVAGPEIEHGMRLLVGDDLVGFERTSSNGLRWGIVGDAASWHGGSTSGAFGDQVQSIAAWIGRSARFELGDTWTLSASATLALGRAFLESGGMLDIDAHVMSAWDVGVEHGKRGRDTWSRIALSQPLRAETGKATLSYLSGLERGAPVYDQATVPLAPEGREIELALTHETPVGDGRGVVEIAHSWDTGHEPGETYSRIGIAYRLNW